MKKICYVSLAAVFAAAMEVATAVPLHEIKINERILSVDDGLLLGNGDLSVSAYQTANAIVFRFGKGDVWNRRMDFTGAPRPGHVDELINGTINEGWKCGSWNGGGLVALKGTKDEKRMREIVRLSPTLGNGPYPCPKPVGELTMFLPVDLPGPAKFSQKVVVEEGRLVFDIVWANGIRVAAEAVVDPEDNVFALRWSCPDWNEETYISRKAACYFTLTRPADPNVRDWSLRRSQEYPYWVTVMGFDYRDQNVKPLPPPVVGNWNGVWGIQQDFYPDSLFPEGFKYRMSLQTDLAKGQMERHRQAARMKDAFLRYGSREIMNAGEMVVTVKTSRDASLEAGAARPYADYAARAKRAAADYWAKSRFEMPSDRELEDLWYATYHARRSILRGGTVPPGLYFPSAVDDFSRWNGDYHANYNMHSTYWGDFTANRLEQADAWCDMMDFFVPLGRKIARDYYNSRGIFVQLEGFPMIPKDDFNGCLPLGRMAYMTGWAMTRHWQYYQYTRDRDWLARRGYPFIRDCALFYLDFLKKAPSEKLPPVLKDGKYHAFPSIQGESGFSGDPMDLCDKPQLLMHVRHTLWVAIEAAKILGVDAVLCGDWQERLDNLAGTPEKFESDYAKFCYYCCPPEHGGNGTVYRPPATDWTPAPKKPRNRFETSYYGHTIRDRIAAVRHSRFIPARDWETYRREIMTWRHPNGLVCAMGIPSLMRTAWTETLSCMAPYQDMLLQSWDGAIRLFPCWPMEKDVSFANWRAQGAFLVSAGLTGGRIGTVTVVSEKGEDCLVWGDWRVTRDGASVATDRDRFGRLRFKTEKGRAYVLVGSPR